MSEPDREESPESSLFVSEDQIPGFWLALALVSLGWVAHPHAFWFHTHPHWMWHNATYILWVIGCWIFGALVVRGLVLWCPRPVTLVTAELPPTDAPNQRGQPDRPEQSLQSAMDEVVSSVPLPMTTNTFRVGGHTAPSHRYPIDPAHYRSHPRQGNAPWSSKDPACQSHQADRATTAQRNPQRMPGNHGGALGRAAWPQDEMPSHPSCLSYAGSPTDDDVRPRISHDPSHQGMPQFMHDQQPIQHTIDDPHKNQDAHEHSSDWFRYCYWWELRYPVGYFLSWGVSLVLIHWTWH